MEDIDTFKVSNYRLAKALGVELERLWEAYIEFADALDSEVKLNDISLDRLFQIGRWHRLKWLERSNSEIWLNAQEIQLLHEEEKYILSENSDCKLTISERQDIDSWHGATLRERLIGFGLFYYCYCIGGEGTEVEMIHLFAYANQNIGHLVHSWTSEAKPDDEIQTELRSEMARHSANFLHDLPGGSREKRRKIKEIWLTGKYDSKDVCAEQECAAIDMSFATARKALRGLPSAVSLREQRLAPASRSDS